MHHYIRWVCTRQSVWSVLTPRCSLPFTLLWSLLSCPSSHPSCILRPSLASGHLGTCCAPISVFPTVVRKRRTGGTGQEPVLLQKGHATLLASLRKAGQARFGGKHTSFFPSFSCPGPVLGSMLPFLQSCSAPRIPQLSPFAQCLHLASLPFTLSAYLWGLGAQLTLVTPTPLPLPKSPALSRCLLQPPLHFFCSLSPSLDLPPLLRQP